MAGKPRESSRYRHRIIMDDWDLPDWYYYYEDRHGRPRPRRLRSECKPGPSEPVVTFSQSIFPRRLTLIPQSSPTTLEIWCEKYDSPGVTLPGHSPQPTLPPKTNDPLIASDT
uniref:Uncharacterized protein n=1 Tax=Branchiostoma floridae TaxID=7739 RepID=C3XZL4_BRAFL|eukprot:XP_002610525.1 hypothetical protein BRAFLDRAFT_65690 [Branchiostoma floridae]